MQISEQCLIQIIERASTINERFSGDFIVDELEADSNIIDLRLQRWCQVVAQGNQEQFKKRLAWNKWDINTIRFALGQVKLLNPQRLPSWAKVVKSALQMTPLADFVKADFNHQPVPFEELYLPFVVVAREQLVSRAGTSYHWLTTGCHLTLEWKLLDWLSRLCSRTMELEFAAFRACKQPVYTLSGTRWFGQFPGCQSKEQYNAFIREMQEGRLLSFFQEYSVLARLVGTLTEFWVETIHEFLLHLEADWCEIQQTFGGETDLAQVVSVWPFLSDRHHNGRTVIAIQFSSGLKVVYKPKDLGLEVAYFQLLDWFNQHDSPLPFKLLKVSNHLTHGWVEYVEQLPCRSQFEAKRYYQRAGMLLCLLYAFEGTDIHHENVVACGEHPVLVDMETLFHHRVREIDSLGDAALDLANEQLLDSVLRTYFLPRWEFGAGGESYDISGLGGFGGHQTSLQVPKWENINTDGMKLKYENFVTQPSHNVPFLEGQAISPNQYVEDLVAGFEQMYRFLMAQKEALLAPDSPLTKLAPQRVRFIFRHTKIYASVFKNILNPQYLRDGADQSIELDVLTKAMLGAAEPPIFWPLIELEKQAMTQLDIPLFTASSDSNSLMLAGDKIIEECFAQPSYDLVILRLKQLNEDDLKIQISFIWGSFYASKDGEIHPLATDKTSEQLDLSVVAVLTSSALVEQSIKIARELRQRAIYAGESSATWISLTYMPEAGQYQLLPMGYRLYDGCTGVALFLAALAKVTGDASFRDLALAALTPLRQGLHKDSNYIAREIGIGGGMGCGSLIYGLVRTSQFLEEDFLEEAKIAAALITPERIADDHHFDLLLGSAGAILGLLTLYEVNPEPTILQKAMSCGQHLLNNRVTSESGYKAWATMNNTILTGFSHGAAGIAYALLRLYQVSSEQQFLEAALESHAYETSVFMPEKNNWPDFRFPSTKQGFICWCSWCHGASGIGLGRVAELDILPAEKIRPDIDAAINTTKQQELNHLDQLCCGNLGRVELLLTASKKLNQPKLMEIGMQQTSQVIARAEHKGRFGLNWEAGPYNPGFFQGTTGIGYQLLRLAHPDLLPSALLWE